MAVGIIKHVVNVGVIDVGVEQSSDCEIDWALRMISADSKRYFITNLLYVQFFLSVFLPQTGLPSVHQLVSVSVWRDW